MAKVSTLEFQLGTETFKTNVNVGVDGIFKTELPVHIARVLKLDHKMSNKTLDGLKIEFHAALKRYREAETTQELLIMIRYGASGHYQKSDGIGYMYGSGSPYEIRTSFDGCDCVGFEFHVAIKESVDGVETLYTAQRKRDSVLHFEGSDEEGDQWVKGRHFYGDPKYKKIPFNEVHYDTLLKARESMRKISQMLFTFIEQDTDQMQLSLSGGKLFLGS